MVKVMSRSMLLLTLTLLAACASEPDRNAGRRQFTILAINDIYRIEGVEGGIAGGLARVRHLRAELEGELGEVLLLHAGDFLFPSLMSRQYGGAQMVDVMNLLDGDAEAFDDHMLVTFGNHEFDADDLDDAPALAALLDASQFRWLDTNLEWAADASGAPVVASANLAHDAMLELGGVKVGLFSLTTNFKDPAYITSFGDWAEIARSSAADLRSRGAEVVVALTHLRVEQDAALLEALGDDGPDLVIGGHEHELIVHLVGERYILKADAEARSANLVTVTVPSDGPPRVTSTNRPLLADAIKDPLVDARVGEWQARLDEEYCAGIGRGKGCLEEVVGKTQVDLVAEELEIRRFETNLGNWVMDQGLAAFAGDGAQLGFVNSGALRLNQDIPPGDVTLEHIEEIFQYSSGLVLLDLTGETLQQVVDHAVRDWSGNGKWLQIAGFAYRHDPKSGTASDLTLLTPDGPRPIDPAETLRAAVIDFLATPGTGQDGYTMLTREMWVEGQPTVPDLRELTLAALAAAGEAGIAPEVEGRICNTEREGPCLAVPAQ